jgi:uncharacterized protein
MNGPMISAQDRDLIASVLAPYAEQIEKVAVFGSRATGRARPNSDIDLVLYGDVDEKVERRLATEFEDSRLAVSVDVAVYARIKNALLKEHIDAVATELLSQDELQRQAQSFRAQQT